MSTRAKSKASPAETWLMLGAGLIAVLVTLPILTIVLLSFASSENIWPHLLQTVLPGYVWRTLGLMVGVGFLTFIIGTATAWLVSLHDFPLRRILQWACLMPLAMPTYIVSYTYVDFLNYAGSLQTWLRGAMGWSRPEDYMFPEIRSLPGAVLVLALVLYPYVYMTAQASFLRQPMSQLDVARTLGKSPWGAFLSVALPQARPAIVVGVSLALMECLNDIAAVGFFGVNTLTLGIYTTWLGEGNLGGAAQLAVVLLIFVFALLWVERHARKQQSYMPGSRHPMAPRRTPLTGWRGILGHACLFPAGVSGLHPAGAHSPEVRDTASGRSLLGELFRRHVALAGSLAGGKPGGRGPRPYPRLCPPLATRRAAQHVPQACQCGLCHAGNGARHRRAYSAGLFRQHG